MTRPLPLFEMSLDETTETKERKAVPKMTDELNASHEDTRHDKSALMKRIVIGRPATQDHSTRGMNSLSIGGDLAREGGVLDLCLVEQSTFESELSS